MSRPTPQQARWIARTEAMIRLMAPVFDTVLAVGERISRTVEPRDLDYVAARPLPREDAVRELARPRP